MLTPCAHCFTCHACACQNMRLQTVFCRASSCALSFCVMPGFGTNSIGMVFLDSNNRQQVVFNSNLTPRQLCQVILVPSVVPSNTQPKVWYQVVRAVVLVPISGYQVLGTSTTLQLNPHTSHHGFNAFRHIWGTDSFCTKEVLSCNAGAMIIIWHSHI